MNYLKKQYKILLPLLNYIPLGVFMFYARKYNFSDDAWEGAFYLAGSLSVVVVMIQVLARVTISKFLLAVHFYLMTCASLFLFKQEKILSIVDSYKGPVFFAFIILIDIAVTFMDLVNRDKETTIIKKRIFDINFYVMYCIPLVYSN